VFNFIGKSQDFEKKKEKQSRSTKGREGRREMVALCTLHKTDTKSKTQYKLAETGTDYRIEKIMGTSQLHCHTQQCCFGSIALSLTSAAFITCLKKT
jgi:hypothetical protein